MHELVFVLEQTLGHVAHSRNIIRCLDRHSSSVHATVIPIEYRRAAGLTGLLPGFRTWTFDASRQAQVALGRRLQSGPVDALFIHTQVAATLAGPVMRRVPTVVSIDATPINYDSQGAAYGHSVGAAPVEALKLRLNRYVFDRAAHIVSWCSWAADSLTAHYGVPAEKISVIHPGVDVELFTAPDRSHRDCPVRVLFVGGDFARKGGPELMSAMQRVGSRAELDVVTMSEVTVPPGVTCRVHRGLGPQAPELVRLYRDADVFALPSRGDCFPQAVAEALASGLPVVASDAGAIPEMVRDGYNGVVVPRRDVQALAEALELLVRSATLRRRMGIASRGLAEREHDADRNNRRIVELMVAIPKRTAAQRLSA